MSVLHVASGALVTLEHRRALQQRWAPVLARYGVDRTRYTRFAASASRIAGSRDASTPSLAFEPVEDLLHPVAREPGEGFDQSVNPTLKKAQLLVFWQPGPTCSLDNPLVFPAESRVVGGS